MLRGKPDLTRSWNAETTGLNVSKNQWKDALRLQKINWRGPAGCFEKFQKVLRGENLITSVLNSLIIWNIIAYICIKGYQCWGLQFPPPTENCQNQIVFFQNRGSGREPACGFDGEMEGGSSQAHKLTRQRIGLCHMMSLLWSSVAFVRKYGAFLAEKEDYFF